MIDQCGTCAFREGSTTHDQEPYNRLRSMICAHSGVPFYCHRSIDWKRPKLIVRGMVIQANHEPTRLRICEGWRQQVVRHVKPGGSWVRRIMRKAAGQAALEAIDQAVGAEDDSEEKAQAWSKLSNLIDKLFKHSEEAPCLKVKSNSMSTTPDESRIPGPAGTNRT